MFILTLKSPSKSYLHLLIIMKLFVQKVVRKNQEILKPTELKTQVTILTCALKVPNGVQVLTTAAIINQSLNKDWSYSCKLL